MVCLCEGGNSIEVEVRKYVQCVGLLECKETQDVSGGDTGCVGCQM